MRILIDLLGFTGERGGTETYARQISSRLHESLEGVQLVALANAPSAERVRAFFPGEVRAVKWVGADRLTWALGEIFAVNRAARAVAADVIWSPANFGPVRRATPFVMTFHDVVYKDWRGGLADRLIRSTAWWMMRRASRVATAVITGSRAAAADLVEHALVDPTIIHVIAHGTAAPDPPEKPWAELAQLGIDSRRPIVLSTGNRLPHKNFTGLLEAVASIQPDRRPLTVIPGSHGADPLTDVVRALAIESDVILPGWVTRTQLEALYEVADLYVCPSMTEGFGLPVIDAMMRGCPVLANDIPVLREVGGNAARYADATDPHALAAAIESAIADGHDAARESEGVEWASQFTWEASAARTAAVLAATAASSERD